MTMTNESPAPLTDAVVQLTGEDGNAFAIIGRVYVSSKPSPSWCVPEERGCFVRLIDMRQLHIVNHAHF